MNSDPTILHLVGSLGWMDHCEQMRVLAHAHRGVGRHVHVVALQGRQRDCAELVKQRIDCRIIRRRWSRDPFAAHQLTQFVGRNQPQIIHCWGTETAEFAAILRWAAPRSRIVATLEKPLSDRLFWIPGSTAALDAMATDAPQYSARHMPNVTFIEPGVDPGPARSRTELLKALQLAPDAKLIVTACHLERSERLDEALWNFELVRTLLPSAVYLVVGTGPERTRLERYCRLVSEPQAVRFLHPRDWYPEVVRQADLYWHPGTCTVVPTGLLHAKAAGVPCLVDDQTVTEPVLVDGVDGMLAPTEDRALTTRLSTQVLNDPAAFKPLTSAGQERFLQRFTRDRFVARYEALYRLQHESDLPQAS